MKTSKIFAVAVMRIVSAMPASARIRHLARSAISPASNGQTPPAAPRCPMSFVTGISLGNGQHASVAYPVSNGQPIAVYGYTRPTSGGGSADGDYRRAWANCS